MLLLLLLLLLLLFVLLLLTMADAHTGHPKQQGCTIVASSGDDGAPGYVVRDGEVPCSYNPQW